MLGLHEGRVQGGHLGREEGMHEEKKLLKLGAYNLLRDGGLGERVEKVELQSGVAVVGGTFELRELVGELGGNASETFQDETLLPI